MLSGLRSRDAMRFISRLVILGLVRTEYRQIERDRGYPYTVTDYFLNERGARVVDRMERELEIKYTDDDRVISLGVHRWAGLL